VAPPAGKGAAFEENGGADARAVVKGVLLDSEYGAGYGGHLRINGISWFWVQLQRVESFLNPGSIRASGVGCNPFKRRSADRDAQQASAFYALKLKGI
jgi:hypothetical protein